MDSSELTETLESYLGEHLNTRDRPEVSDLTQHNQGFSDFTYTFDVRYRTNGEERRRSLALRQYVPGGLLRSFMLSLRTHYEILAALQGSGVPVPEVLWFEEDESWLGAPFFVMRKLEGTVPVAWSSEGRSFLEELRKTSSVREQFVRILVNLHQFDWREAGLDEAFDVPSKGEGVPSAWVRRMRDLHEDSRIGPYPIVREGLGWLEHNRIPCETLALTHGDFRPGNFLFHEQKIVGVLDWETAAVTDPMYDVAWIVSQINRVGSDLCCNLFEEDWFYRTYEEMTGWEIDEERVHYYEVVHQMRTVLQWMSGAKNYAREESDDVRLARGYYSIRLTMDRLAELLGF